ncbi:hypothetical protein ACZ90_70985 [Streptomyces albus subsp. albus]|nr:hypothetical protein ACZ90_70985 [Streptomyces albus subsp. albus]
MSYRAFLAELLMTECDDRARRCSERRIKAASFPRDKSLRAFDTNPNIDPATVNTLAACEWVKKGEPKLRCTASVSAMATKLVNELVEAADEKQLQRAIPCATAQHAPRWCW